MQKNLKLIAVLFMLAIHIFNTLTNLDYYSHLFTYLSEGFYGWSSGMNYYQQILYLGIRLLSITLITVFLTTTGRTQQKTYKLLRYITVIMFFMYIPSEIYFYAFLMPDSLSGKYWIMHAVRLVLEIISVILLLKAKADNQPARIDISQYELVSYTSMGHRFIHYLVDSIFLLPYIMYLMTVGGRVVKESSLVFSTLVGLYYLLYCALSESIFGQTLGKMATNSCVVSIGRPLTTGRIILRTLARRIPFDNFSFLFSANWHDRVTSTAVVYQSSWENVFTEEEVPAHNPAAETVAVEE